MDIEYIFGGSRNTPPSKLNCSKIKKEYYITIRLLDYLHKYWKYPITHDIIMEHYKTIDNLKKDYDKCLEKT